MQAVEAQGGVVWREAHYEFVTLEVWLQQVFGELASDSIADWSADWGRDGLANLLERAFGLDPSVPDTNPTAQRLTRDSSHVTLTDPTPK